MLDSLQDFCIDRNFNGPIACCTVVSTIFHNLSYILLSVCFILFSLQENISLAPFLAHTAYSHFRFGVWRQVKSAYWKTCYISKQNFSYNAVSNTVRKQIPISSIISLYSEQICHCHSNLTKYTGWLHFLDQSFSESFAETKHRTQLNFIQKVKWRFQFRESEQRFTESKVWTQWFAERKLIWTIRSQSNSLYIHSSTNFGNVLYPIRSYY